ncbi:MAG: hypothetical protein ACJAXW_002766 [Candidatus Azotimanducaceae bacterium]|jgi:hypothetical protein
MRVVGSAVDGLKSSGLNNVFSREFYPMARAIPTFIVVLIISSMFVVLGQWQSSNKGSEHVEVEKAEEVASVLKPPLAQSDLSASSTEGDTESELWTEIINVPAAPPAIRSDIPRKRLIKLNRESLSALSVGQEVNITIPHLNSSVRVSIRTVDKLASGNISILGKIDGNPLLDFVMTVSEMSTFATIGTEQGVYNLRGDESLAWIAPAKAFNHHVDPAVLDYRVPKQPDAQAASNQG